MPRLYSYIIKNDNGSAPNPFWKTCTLTICKPAIRRTANIGDWVIGTGSKNSKLKDGKNHDLAGYLVYAMKIGDKKTLEEYDKYCRSNCQIKYQGGSILIGVKDWVIVYMIIRKE